MRTIPVETRFPLGKPLEAPHAVGRCGTRSSSRAPREERGSLTRDIVRYLQRLKGQPAYKAERSHLRACLHQWRRLRRWEITTEKVELAIADWRQSSVGARTIRHWHRALRVVFRRLVGQLPTPIDTVGAASTARERI